MVDSSTLPLIRIWVASAVSAMTSAATNILIFVFYCTAHQFFLEIHQGVELLGYKLGEPSALGENAALSKVAVLI